MTQFVERTTQLLDEMNESPCEDGRSRLEWLADWLDSTDSLLGVPADQHEVQDDLRRWAREIRDLRG